MPPDGGFLGNIPVEFIRAARRHLPAATVAHGQSFLWAGAEHGAQGVTELEEHRKIRFTMLVYWLPSFPVAFVHVCLKKTPEFSGVVPFCV